MRFSFLRRPALSVLTWNVWFGLEKPRRRWTALLDTVRRLRPHIVAFQEVTEPFLSMLRKESWVRKSYALSDPSGESIRGYGNLIMSTSPLRDVETHPLDSEMDRAAVVAHTNVAGSDWAVASLHLESFQESAQVRGRQLTQALKLTGSYPNVLLMGDLNFCASWTEENDRIPSDFVDVWPAVRADEGFTVDTTANAMRLRDKKKEKRVRFDRILVRSALVTPAGARLVGTKKIRGERPSLFPSDHFGVWGSFRRT